MSSVCDETVIEILTSANLREPYLECVPHFIESILALRSSNLSVRFAPKVYLIADEIPSSLTRWDKWIETFPTTLPSSFIAQNCRTFLAGLSEASVVITADIDLFPIHSRPFERALTFLLPHGTHRSKFVVLRSPSERAQQKQGQIAICYNAAAPETWRGIMGADTRKKVVTKLQRLWAHHRHDRFEDCRLGSGWYWDQELLWDRVAIASERGSASIVWLTDSETKLRRLEGRASGLWRLRWLLLPLITLGVFTEVSPRLPVSRDLIFLAAVRWAREARKRTNQIFKTQL